MQRFISPGVFTQENDLTFLPQGIGEIGAAFIGGFEKGPAFTPTVVSSLDQLQAVFGDSIPEYYAGRAASLYLKDASKATVVRVLGLDGYDNAVVKSYVLYVSGSGGQVPFALLHPSRGGVTLATASVTGSPTSFVISLSGSQYSASYSGLSLVDTSTSYIGNTFGTNATSAKDAYLYSVFSRALTMISGANQGSGSVVIAAAGGALMLSGSVSGIYSEAITPFIRSQTIGGGKSDLFRLHTIADGTVSNTAIKVSITNVRPDPLGSYGRFSLLVRDYSDTDAKVNVLEQYDNLSIDPNSADYIARRIGDSYPVVDTTTGVVHMLGDFQTISRYLYVEMATGIQNAPVTALPYGFQSVHPSLNLVGLPSASYTQTRYYTLTGTSSSVANNKVYYGYTFSDTTNAAYLNASPSGTAAAYVGGEFSLETVADADVTGSNLTSATSLGYRKFTVPFQGGFDGMNPARQMYTAGDIISTNTQGFDLSTGTSPGSKAFALALDAIKNPEGIDINLLVVPGVLYQYHPYIAQKAIDICEARGDCFYIMDSAVWNSSIANAVTTVAGLDTNYAGTYFPWIKVLDSNTNRQLWVTPSVVLPQVFAFNDKVGAEWFAPAGLTRAGIGSALMVKQVVSTDDRDTLYDGRINPIARYPNQGIAVWGQKTLQQADSAFNRINIRRLLIAAKKYIASASRYLVFEQNVDATRQRFLNIVNPYLASIQERSGIYAFRVVMDETNNTPDLIDRNILYGQIYLQPVRAAEFIMLDFNVTATGASFGE